MSEQLTVIEFFTLFNRSVNDTRWLSSADSIEFLAVVIYLIKRNSKEA